MENLDLTVQKYVKELRLKALISWVYLLLFVGVFVVALFIKLLIPSFKDSSVSVAVLILLTVTAISYFFHFYYGAFYFPRKYRRALENGWFSHWDPMDLSNFRGTIATASSLTAFFCFYWNSDLKNLLGLSWSSEEWLISLVWVFFNLIIFWKTRTQGFMEMGVVEVNQEMIFKADKLLSWGARWEVCTANERGLKDKKNYKKIGFFYPDGYSPYGGWMDRALDAYVKSKYEENLKNLETERSESQKNRQADSLTYEAIARAGLIKK